MEKEIKLVKVRIIQEVGRERFYPASKEAELVCKLVRAKTLTRDQLTLLVSLGLKVEIEKSVVVKSKIETEEFKGDENV